jgi:prepilin-type N-terminal cleavage/methylation domain-containing protein
MPGSPSRARRGFTLIEMIVVLIILSIVMEFSVPAMLRMGTTPQTATDDLALLFRSARAAALAHGVPVRVIIDPESGEYRADTLGTDVTGPIAEGTLDSPIGRTIETDSARVRFTFLPSGIAYGDSLIVRADGVSVKVTVDPLTGVFRVEPR